MELFKKIAEIIGANDDVTLVVRKTGPDALVVSVRVENRSVTDGAKALIPPFVVKGSPEELDAEFLDVIAQPLEESAGLQTSMQNFETSKKLAEAQSQAAKAAAEKAKKDREAAKTKVEAALKDADALKEARSYAEGRRAYAAAKDLAEKAGLSKEAALAKDGMAFCSDHDVPDMFAGLGDNPPYISETPNVSAPCRF